MSESKSKLHSVKDLYHILISVQYTHIFKKFISSTIEYNSINWTTLH